MWLSLLWSQFVRCYVYSKPKARLVHSSNHTEHYRKKFCFVTGTECNCISPQCMLHWHISVTGHGQRMVCFPQHKPLLKWTVDFTVTPCSTSYGCQITRTFWCCVICNLAVSFWRVTAHWELQFNEVPWNAAELCTFEWLGVCVCVCVCVCLCICCYSHGTSLKLQPDTLFGS